MIVPEKDRPFPVEQQTVCLQGVFNLQIFGIVFLLQLDRFFVKVKSGKGRLAALKCKGQGTIRISDGFFDECFQSLL